MELEDDFQENSGTESDVSDENFTKEQQSSSRKRKYENIPTDSIQENGKSKKSKHKNDLYKPPTVEELNNLKETENLYNNSLFRLQIQELISEVNIKNKRKKCLSTWLDCFQYFLDNLPEYDDVLLSDIKIINKKKLSKQEKFINKLADYENILKVDQDVTIKFIKPESFEKFGLYEHNSLPGPDLFLNINLVMPKSCFHIKDFLNNRYLCKRYYYLLYIAEKLKLSNFTSKVTLSFHEGSGLLPILQVEPNGGDKILIMIYASPSSEYFKPTRFVPEQNNLKQDLFGVDVDGEVLKNTPTILYNSVLGHDVTLSLNNNFIKEILSEQNSVQEAIKLLCVWLKQRELNIGLGSFSESFLVYFIVYLFSKKKINKYMSSYQVVRNFWNFISTTDLNNEPISIGDASKDFFDSFKKNFDVVCLDKSGCYNVTAFLNLDVYKKVKLECQTAMKLLDSNKNNSFQQLFLVRYPFYLQYDLIIDLTKSLPLEDKYGLTDEEKSKYVGFEEILLVKHVSKVIQRALNKRVIHFVPKIEAEQNGCTLNKLLFGINLNPDEAFNFIELGPALNNHVAAAEFRTFWGHLSSDRRFRDGSTNVAVYFKTNTIKGKREIIKKILNFVIGEKLELKHKVHYDEFEEVLISKKLLAPYPSGTNEETCLRIIKSSDELGKKIRELAMSLTVTGVQGVSDVFCYSDAFPPMPSSYKMEGGGTTTKGNNLIFSGKTKKVPRYVKPVECTLHLEHSSKWPNDLKALRHIKTTFYLEISKMLQKNHNIISHVTPNFLDVFFEGTVFRYSLYVPKEIVLVKKESTETGLTSYRESTESKTMEKELNILPKVISALRGLQSLYPSYGPGTALVKRWLRSQLVDDYLFPDVLINLLNASLYLNNCNARSNTPQISFLRFLKFMSEFDWKLQVVLVNFNDDITKEEIVELESKLQKNREAYPALYIITPYDKETSLFSKDVPTQQILFRVKQLAQESLRFIHGIITDQNCVGIKELFIPNFDGYNVLIHLHPAWNPRKHEQILFANAENRTLVEKYRPDKKNKLPIVGLNPVEIYLSTLRENYGKYALFFHDSFGGNTVGVLWSPKVYEKDDFKVSKVNAGMLVDGKITFNMDAVIDDFYMLGKGLVKMIEKR